MLNIGSDDVIEDLHGKQIYCGGQVIPWVETYTYLGLKVDRNFNNLAEPLIVKAQRASYMLKRALSKKCSPALALEIFARTVEPILFICSRDLGSIGNAAS